jgi:hypothetical protein
MNPQCDCQPRGWWELGEQALFVAASSVPRTVDEWRTWVTCLEGEAAEGSTKRLVNGYALWLAWQQWPRAQWRQLAPPTASGDDRIEWFRYQGRAMKAVAADLRWNKKESRSEWSVTIALRRLVRGRKCAQCGNPEARRAIVDALNQLREEQMREAVLRLPSFHNAS